MEGEGRRRRGTNGSPLFLPPLQALSLRKERAEREEGRKCCAVRKGSNTVHTYSTVSKDREGDQKTAAQKILEQLSE